MSIESEEKVMDAIDIKPEFVQRIAAGGYFAMHRVRGPEAEEPQPEPQPQSQPEPQSQADEETRPFDLDHLKRMVPLELRERQQWVIWRYEEKDGRPTKMPYEPVATAAKRRRASTTDPDTWGQFGSALAVCDLEKYDGVGFVLSADDPYVGIDLDHCRDPHTGEI